MSSHIKDLVVFAGENYCEGHNSAIQARTLARLQETSRSSETINPDERAAMERVKKAVARYAELQHLAELGSSN